jgi:hypothetical protein
MGDPKPEPNCHPYTCRACMHRMFLLSLRSNAHDQTNIYGSLLYLSFFKSVCHMFCIKIEEEILQHQPQQQGQYMQHKANTNNHLTIHSTVQRTKPHALCHRGRLRALHCALPKVTCNVDTRLAKRPCHGGRQHRRPWGAQNFVGEAATTVFKRPKEPVVRCMTSLGPKCHHVFPSTTSNQPD